MCAIPPKETIGKTPGNAHTASGLGHIEHITQITMAVDAAQAMENRIDAAIQIPKTPRPLFLLPANWRPPYGGLRYGD